MIKPVALTIALERTILSSDYSRNCTSHLFIHTCSCETAKKRHAGKKAQLSVTTHLKYMDILSVKQGGDPKKSKMDLKNDTRLLVGTISCSNIFLKCGNICNRVGSENSVRVKALNETILRLSRANESLQQENKGLKEDLQNAIDEADVKPDLERMSQCRVFVSVTVLCVCLFLCVFMCVNFLQCL